MGNANPKPTKLSKLDKQWHSTQTQFSISSNFSSHSVYSASRPWSRSSRRRWKESTLGCPMNAAKTAWPVSVVESMFLPEFPVKGEIDEHSFQVVETIARGAFGKVLKVIKKDTGKIYAMKVLSKSHVVMENAVQQCKDEVAIQSLCGDHPFIVGCLYYWQNRKQLFLVTEYVPYGELLVLWKTYGQLPEKVVQLYIAELAITIDYLHNSGVIYRDLKMENILLDREGHVQLIDFGLAKWLQSGGRARTICGTIQYMAPEVLRMETYTHAVDWWSLGIIMYALLVGTYPVASSREHTKMSELVADFNYSLPADAYSTDARHFLQRLLCKDPSRRLQSLYHMHWEPFMRPLDLDMVKEKKLSPQKLLDALLQDKSKNQPNGQAEFVKDKEDQQVAKLMETFSDFDWVNNSAQVF